MEPPPGPPLLRGPGPDMGSLLTVGGWEEVGGPPEPAGGGTPRGPDPGEPELMDTEEPVGGPEGAPASDLTLPGLWLG